MSKVACKDECVRAIRSALCDIDDDLGDEMFDGLLRLIAAHVPYYDSEVLSASIYGHICDVIGAEANWRLLYRATRDGFTRESFHTLCDAKGPRTVTIALVDDFRGDAALRGDQRVVGGYTSVSWSSDFTSHQDPAAFIFAADRHSQLIKLFPVNDATGEAVIHSEYRGPAFSADLVLLNSNGFPADCSCMVLSYSGDEDGDYAREDLLGQHGVNVDVLMSREFHATDIEVFVV